MLSLQRSEWELALNHISLLDYRHTLLTFLSTCPLVKAPFIHGGLFVFPGVLCLVLVFWLVGFWFSLCQVISSALYCVSALIFPVSPSCAVAHCKGSVSWAGLLFSFLFVLVLQVLVCSLCTMHIYLHIIPALPVLPWCPFPLANGSHCHPPLCFGVQLCSITIIT